MLTRKPVVVATVVLLLVTVGAQANGDPQRGKDLAYDCIECHGIDGKGNFETPEIAGLEEAYILEQLRDFYSGKRESLDDMMHLYTEDRSDQDLQDLAAYWASIKEQ